MPGCCSTISYPSLIRRIAGADRRGPNLEPSRLNGHRPHSPIQPRSPIHILNDDVLLNIFELYRPPDPESEEYRNEIGLVFVWIRGCWWYKLAHVCRQWRNIILESPSRLDLHLFCTNGVPVADMLAHSPPLPLTIYYTDLTITAEDESGILLALSHRDRVRHVYLWMLNVGKFAAAIDDQFPIMESMFIRSRIEVVLPLTFQAPNLRHLMVWRASIPIGSPLLTTAPGLVTLELKDIPRSAYFPPSYLLTQLSLVLQLERLSIEFHPPLPNRDVEWQLHQAPDTIVLPNLHFFRFKSTAVYLEDLVARISAPLLNHLHVYLDHQPSFTFPRLLQFIQTSENLGFTAVQVTFFGDVSLSLHAVSPSRKAPPLLFQIWCGNLDWQVRTAAQLFGTLSPVLSVVEKVTFSYQEHYLPRASHNNVDRSQWRELLRPFTNAKTIHVHDNLVNDIFCSLPSEDGEPPLEFLPNLEEVGYSGESDIRDAFITFLNGRQVAGHPVTLRIVDRSVFEERSGFEDQYA